MKTTYKLPVVKQIAELLGHHRKGTPGIGNENNKKIESKKLQI